jgi:hypothetical protein
LCQYREVGGLRMCLAEAAKKDVTYAVVQGERSVR